VLGPVVSVTVAEHPSRGSSDVVRLIGRRPRVDAVALIDSLVPPPLFDQVSFDSFQPDGNEPTQAAALAALGAFSERLVARTPEPKWWRRAPAPPEGRAGVYLDGGFGVGKTHLLASLWHVAPAPKAFATFVELTHAVGALGFNEAAHRLSAYRLVCIDEFELDDPGDTMLMSTLLAKLTESGVRLAATSNTLPDRLGEDRFAAADFLREINQLAGHFDVLRIEGPDYRHRGTPDPPAPVTDAQLLAAVEGAASAAVDDFVGLLDHLATVHPSAYGPLVEGIDVAGWRDVHTIDDQAVALRFVVLVDRLYDRGVRVVASGIPLDEVFTPDMLQGGYRKKYFRALSRLVALANLPPRVQLGA
jgi:cell division protein ZapE